MGGCVRLREGLINSTFWAGTTRFFPRERSRKKAGSSGSFDRKFAPDGFFNFEPPPSIIVCQVIHGFVSLLALRDHSCWNTGACQHRPPEGNLWVDDDGFWLLLEVAFPRKEVESDWYALEVSLNAMKVCLKNLVNG